MDRIKTVYKVVHENTFECFFVGAIVLILILALINWLRGKKGSWSNTYFMPVPLKYIQSNNHQIQTQASGGPPKKTDSKGELECRRVLQKIFKKPFDKCRPHFLNNPVTGGSYNLELDCYDDEYKIAVEYNGIQHYKFSPYFHKNNEAFLNQKYRDELKKRMCKENGIILITVPYTVKVEDIERFIINALV
jgi:hypothetical protein